MEHPNQIVEKEICREVQKVCYLSIQRLRVLDGVDARIHVDAANKVFLFL